MNCNKKISDAFIGKYSVTRCVEFEARPVGKTQSYIGEYKIIETDKELSEKSYIVKGYMNDYHRAFIDSVLSRFSFSDEVLNEFERLYSLKHKDKSESKQFRELTKKMRTDIEDSFKDDERYDPMFKKELVQKILPSMYSEDKDALEVLKLFDKFTTYFKAFNDNRKFIYSSDNKHGTISHRIVHQNFPKFIDNINIYNRLMENGEIREQVAALSEKIGFSISDYFKISGFNNVLSQEGIDKYNVIISGIAKEDGEKIQGLNEIVNIYNQNHKTSLPKFQKLFKQILSIATTFSFIPERFNSDLEMFDAINSFYEYFNECVIENHDGLNITQLMTNLSNFDLSKVYIGGDQKTINFISYQMFGDWGVIRSAIEYNYDCTHTKGRSLKKYEEDRDKYIKNTKQYSICELNTYLSNYGKSSSIDDYFANRINGLLIEINNAYLRYSNINMDKYIDGRSIKCNDPDKATIQSLLDAINNIKRTLKSFDVVGDILDKDDVFYGEFFKIYDCLSSVNNLYNKVRNYVTGKPYCDETFLLNFGCASDFLGGWSNSIAANKRGILLKKDENEYYLGILNKNRKWIENPPTAKTNNTYSLLYIQTVGPVENQVPRLLHVKKDNYDKDTIVDIVDAYDNWSVYNFDYDILSSIESYDEFIEYIKEAGSITKLVNIDSSYIDSLVDDGDMFMFRLYCKDFSPYSKGTPDIHTMYFKQLFSQENIDNQVFGLGGNSQLRFRPASLRLEDTPVHKANKPIANKNPLNDKKFSCFSYDIIKDRRYTEDKIIFHLPIKINEKKGSAPKRVKDFNYDFNLNLQAVAKNNNINVIGIDRGENNLVYVSVLDMNGRILEQHSYNIVETTDKDNRTYKTDYNKILSDRDKKNDEARNSWGTIDSSTETKKGYIGQIIHKIILLQDKYNAIIVLEKLDSDFIRKRQKIEKNIYTMFENALIKKFSYCVDKKKGYNENGGLRRGHQLVLPFNKEDMDKIQQSGIIFFVNPGYTSKIDPSTGFVNLLNTKYKDINTSKEFISKFNRFWFDAKTKMYAIDLDYNNFTGKAGNSRTKWILYTNGERILYSRDHNNCTVKTVVNLTSAFDDLFTEYGIVKNTTDMRWSILETKAATFYEKFMKLVYLTVSLRVSDSSLGIDKIISPVMNDDGTFFETDINSNEIPKDGDANGSFNIGRKGIILLDKILNSSEEELKDINLTISNEEWFLYTNNHQLQTSNVNKGLNIIGA